MSFDDIAAEFNLDDLCPEIDNQLQGDFIDILGNNEFELGIFPEEDPNNDSNFIITCEFMEASGSINSSQVEQVKLKVTDALKNIRNLNRLILETTSLIKRSQYVGLM